MSPHDGRCLDYNPGNNNLYWYSCHGQNNQKFYFEDNPPARIKTLYDNKCIDMSHDGNLYMHGCHGGANQVFYFENKYVVSESWNPQRMRNQANGNCWDIHTGNDNLYAGGCHNGNNQKFYFAP